MIYAQSRREHKIDRAILNRCCFITFSRKSPPVHREFIYV